MNRIIHVDAGNGYNVVIGAGIISRCGEILQNLGVKGKIAVITDSNVGMLYLEPVLQALRAEDYDVCSFMFSAGESSKNISTLTDILEFLAKNQFSRSDCVVALGGGVTGDITGFAAGCYMRGIAYIQMPTTLLASVDSSVGGKTAINLSAGKNLAGLFIQPRAVICDTDTLKTLTPEIFADGAAEAIKTAILGDTSMFEIFKNGDSEKDIVEVIAGCVAYKGAIVCEDEFETGVRKLLNLGHTPAHAIEKLSDYSITHGHAVGMGMAVMVRAAARLGYMDIECAKSIQETLRKNGLSVTSPFSSEAMAEMAINDKKRSGDSITVVMPREIGNCTLETIPVSELKALFSAGMEEL